MEKYGSVQPLGFAAFNRQRIKPRVCVVDGKQHIRRFLRVALEEFDLTTCECSDISELQETLKAHLPDLVMLGPSGPGNEAANILKALSENKYGGKVLLLGFDAAKLACVQEIGDEIGLAMLPALPAPFGSGHSQSGFSGG